MKEGKGEWLRLAHSCHALTDGGVCLAQALRAAIGQFLSFEVAPQALHRVEVWGVARQPFLSQPTTLASEIFLHEAALVGGQAIPDQRGLLAPPMAAQVLEESDQALGVIAVRAGLEMRFPSQR